jgi:hypothetical protein
MRYITKKLGSKPTDKSPSIPLGQVTKPARMTKEEKVKHIENNINKLISYSDDYPVKELMLNFLRKVLNNLIYGK